MYNPRELVKNNHEFKYVLSYFHKKVFRIHVCSNGYTNAYTHTFFTLYISFLDI